MAGKIKLYLSKIEIIIGKKGINIKHIGKITREIITCNIKNKIYFKEIFSLFLLDSTRKIILIKFTI